MRWPVLARDQLILLVELMGAAKLYWLPAHHQFLPQYFIFDGYQSIDWAAAYGSGAFGGWRKEDFDYSFYERLIPGSVQNWNPLVAKTGRPPPPNLDALFFSRNIVDDSVLPQTTMLPNEIMSWLDKEMACLRLRRDRSASLFTDPVLLIQYGYRLAMVAGRKYPLNSSQFAAALCMIGLGSITGIGTDRICKHCFRLAPAGLSSCRLHSQSKFVVGNEPLSRSNQSHAARLARRVLDNEKWKEEFEEGYQTLRLWEYAIAGMLWPLRPEPHARWNHAVADALAKSPLVRERLPSNFLLLPNKMQLTLLRTAIDENEWVIKDWPKKILVAQQWFVAESEATGKSTEIGLNKTNEHRVKQADALLAAGLRPHEIADELNISRSHLSQLWRRRKIKNGLV
jgi:hypothetical protein